MRINIYLLFYIEFYRIYQLITAARLLTAALSACLPC